MKSTFHTSVPNMRGRKSYRFSCRCCCAYDFRGKYAAILARGEIEQAKTKYLEKKADTKTPPD